MPDGTHTPGKDCMQLIKYYTGDDKLLCSTDKTGIADNGMVAEVQHRLIGRITRITLKDRRKVYYVFRSKQVIN